jgi:hypothetical protein
MRESVRQATRECENARKGRVDLRRIALVTLLILLVPAAFAQQPDAKPKSQEKQAAHVYANEIRGYQVERVRVEIKQSADSKKGDGGTSPPPDVHALIEFGEPRIVKTTSLGMTLEVPLTLAAIKQEGQVHFLTFEDMVVNGVHVTVEDYDCRFNLPNQRSIRLAEPIHIFISTADALRGALGEWSKPKENWPVTGRVYVFGRFKKYFFSFKRVVPVELSLTLPNPLKKLKAEPALKQ